MKKKHDKPPVLIYAIRCKQTGKVYIGKTKDLSARLNQWRIDIRGDIRRKQENEKYRMRAISVDVEKYGEDSLEVYVLERDIPAEQSQAVEHKWIKEYDATNPAFGYNTRSEEPACGLGTFREGLPINKAKGDKEATR